MSVTPSFPETIIDNSRELHKNDKFNFACDKDKACFTKCCYDVSIILTPYDIFRLKKRLGLTSDEFLRKYTSVHVGSDSGIPVVLLNLDEFTLKCPFLDKDTGCTVYEDRPGACRMYPLVRITYRNEDGSIGDYYYRISESDCLGHNDETTWTVAEWIEHEGLEEYNMYNDYFAEVIEARKKSGILHMHADQINDFYMACYNLDEFKQFFLEGPNLDRYMEDEETIKRISENELELMKYAFKWTIKKVFGSCPTCPVC